MHSFTLPIMSQSCEKPNTCLKCHFNFQHTLSTGHKDIADRLIELQYELTDRIAFYLCGRKPDHRNGHHFIIPEMADNASDLSELAKAAKRKLTSLANKLFEELAMDVYDEVDRRELDEIWFTGTGECVIIYIYM